MHSTQTRASGSAGLEFRALLLSRPVTLGSPPPAPSLSLLSTAPPRILVGTEGLMPGTRLAASLLQILFLISTFSSPGPSLPFPARKPHSALSSCLPPGARRLRPQGKLMSQDSVGLSKSGEMGSFGPSCAVLGTQFWELQMQEVKGGVGGGARHAAPLVPSGPALFSRRQK